MKTARLESLVWVCLYAGVAGLILGAWTAGFDAALGQALAVGGGVLALIGAVLVWLRSRRPADAAPHDDGRGA